jgi:hypothetical protein
MKSADPIQDRSLTLGSRVAAASFLTQLIDIPSMVSYSSSLVRRLPLEATSLVRRTRLLDILVRALL